MKAHRRILLFASTFWLVSAPARAEPLDEVAGALRVCTVGPDHDFASAERLRGSAAVTSAAVLPNPSVRVEHQRTLAGLDERETILGLSVPLGIGGRRFVLQDAARARNQQALADAHTTVFEAALAFREAYVAAVADRAQLDVLSDQQAALTSLSELIQGLTKGGDAAGYDLLRQRTQARMHQRLLEAAKARASASRALLEAWTDREVDLPKVELASLAGGGRALASELSAAEIPQIQSLQARARASALEARAARRRWVPDVELFAGYRAVSAGPETGQGVSLSIELPITFFDHGQGEAARADAEEQLARAGESRVRRLRAAQLKASRLKLTLLEASLADIEVASLDALKIEKQAKQLYASGEVTITELLETFRNAEEARLAQLELTREIVVARLALMRAAGTMFDSALDQRCRGTEGGAR